MLALAQGGESASRLETQEGWLEALPHLVLILDAAGHPLRCNARAELYAGRTLRELAESGTTSFVHPDDLAASIEPLRTRFQQGEPVEGELRLRRSDGAFRWHLVRAVPIRDGVGGTRWIATATDITEHHEAEQRLQERERRAREDAEALVQARTAELEWTRALLVQREKLATAGQLAAGVGHEINNPLTFILANLDFLELEVEALNQAHPDIQIEEMLRCLRDSREGAVRIRTIVRDLRTFARPEVTTAQTVDVVKALEFAATLATNELKHRATLVRELAPVAAVRGDQARLGQVFLNLVVNAAQAIPEGDVPNQRVTLRTYAQPGKVIVEVEDTGAGIEPAVLPRIFDPFFTTKPVGQGTGLGLSICHGIIRAMNGQLTVESTIGRGSLFRVELPAAAAASTELPVAPPLSEPLPSAPVGTGQKLRILVVDDESNIRVALKRILGGHDVVLAESGREALIKLQEPGAPFDLVLCDLMMPEVTGMDVYEAVRARQPALLPRIVFMTGGGFTPRANDFLRSLSNPQVQKPFDRDALRSLIDHVQSRATGHA